MVSAFRILGIVNQKLLEMKLLRAMLFVCLICLLNSCDPGVSYSRVIQNESGYDLQFLVYPAQNSTCWTVLESDTIIVNKHSVKTIGAFSGLGQTFEFENCDLCADSINGKVVNNDTLSLILDLNNRAGWNFSILKKTFKQGGTCECRIKITDEMIK